jgi:Tfp pilus assembly protein PilN
MMQFNLLPHRPQQWRRERRRFYGTLLLGTMRQQIELHHGALRIARPQATR